MSVAHWPDLARSEFGCRLKVPLREPEVFMNTLINPYPDTAIAQPLRARSTHKYTQRITPVQLRLSGLCRDKG